MGIKLDDNQGIVAGRDVVLNIIVNIFKKTYSGHNIVTC